MKIIVVCGAGASSTFVAQRIRRAARERDIAVDVVPTALAMLDTELPDADVVLLGAHLAREAHGLRGRTSVAVAVLPEAAFTDSSGLTALSAALAVVGVSP